MDLPIDESRWPVVVARWQGVIGDEAVEAFLAKMDEWLSRNERFGLLLDSRGAQGMTSAQRQRVVRHMRSHAAPLSRVLVQAIVIDNMIQRTLYQTIVLFFPHPFPSRVFADPEAAREWLVAQLASVARAA